MARGGRPRRKRVLSQDLIVAFRERSAVAAQAACAWQELSGVLVYGFGAQSSPEPASGDWVSGAGGCLRRLGGYAYWAPPSPHVSPDTCLRVLVSPGSAPQTARQDKAELAMGQRIHPETRRTGASSSRLWAFVPEGANDVQGFGRPCPNGENRANVRRRILLTAVRPSGTVSDSRTRNGKHASVLPTTRAKEARIRRPLGDTCSEPARFAAVRARGR